MRMKVPGIAVSIALMAVLAVIVAPSSERPSALASAHAQAPQGSQPQIPSLQACNQTLARGAGQVKISNRADAFHSGTFVVRIDLKCDPAGTGYPTGALALTSLSMSDSTVQGAIVATTFEQVTSTGKHTPTIYLNGRCAVKPASTSETPITGCRYWLMIADNGRSSVQAGTPDVVSFLAFNGLGTRIAYGTGPLVKGDVVIAPTAN